MCLQNGCKKRGYYNFLGADGSYCPEHRLEGMIDIKHNKCEHPDCSKQPNYNLPGETKGKFCNEHRLEGMIDIKHNKCEHPDCETRPNYNLPGETRGRFCKKHKSEGMVDIKSKRCEHLDCSKQPIYNSPGETKARYCAEHKLEGMVDIKNKKCEYPDCSKIPNYNLPGETKAKFCAEHKLEGMVDVTHKMCKTPLCDIQVKDKYRGYCLRCFMYTFPNEPVTRNYKTKETATVDKIREEFEEKVDLISDKIVAGGCSKRRPDCYIDLGYQVIIIEVDENQHTDYDCSCENKRTMELSRDFGHRPIVFIRFNPDKYILDGKVITSCWGTNKKGITTVKKSKVKEWNTRLNTLIDIIEYWIEPENKTSKTVEVIQLYYDND